MIDLRSDTLTHPTTAMRKAMSEADVGDDVFGEDPTINRLESLAAERFGKESALFLPSGTMANLIAFIAQCHPGDSIILSPESHPYRFEAANLARFGGFLTRTPASTQGKIEVAEISTCLVQSEDPHYSPTTLVSIENTTNLGGGAFYTVSEVVQVGALCREKGLRLHCDGARIFNAAIAQSVTVKELAEPCHSVSFCLSKGLGAPVGSLLVSDADTIHEARRVRKQLGGGMRQAGVLAAAGLYALEHHVADLADDHRRAAEFRRHLEAAGLRFLHPSPTNILILASEKADQDVAALKELGVLVLTVGPEAIRVVFHRDITDKDTAQAIAVFKRVMVP